MTPIELTRTLCDIESVSGNEDDIATWVFRYLQQYSSVFQVERVNNCIIARTDFNLGHRVVLAGHLDTVPISTQTANFPSVDKGTSIWGRGAVDMKAGDAVFLALLSRVMDNTLALKYDLTAIFYDNEEVAADLNGLGILAAQRPDLLEGDFAILGEPTNALVEAGCNGSLRFDVVARGKAAHSARSWVGKNAIHKLQQVLAILNEWNDELHIVDVEGLKYIEGLNATKIGGGIATNVIPDEVKVHINYRFAPDKSLETAIANVLQWFEGFEVEIIDKSPAARPGTSLKEVQAFSSVAQKFNNKPIAPKYGWTDVARFSALGVPALNFGPGDALLAHHDEEEVEKSNIELCYNVLEEYLFSK